MVALSKLLAAAPVTPRRQSICALPSAARVTSTLRAVTLSRRGRIGQVNELRRSLVDLERERAAVHGRQLASTPCTRPCRRGRGRATARTRSRGRTARGSPGSVSKSPLFAGPHDDDASPWMPSALQHRHDERRLVFAVAEPAREDLRAAVRLEAVDAELERDVAGLLRRRSRRRRAPSRARR